MPLLGSLSAIGSEYSSQLAYVVESALTANEGTTVTFTITATGIADNTTLYYTTTGTVNSSDLSSGALSGSFSLTNGSYTVSMTFSNDLTTEGNETVRLFVHLNSTSGPVIAASNVVTIIDTSTAPYGSVVVLGRSTALGTNNVISTAYWTVPAGVTSISIVAIGAGGSGTWTDTYLVGSGGGGGALSYRNNVAVTPGEQLKFDMGWPVYSGYYIQPGETVVTKSGSGSFIVGAQPGKMPYMGTPGTQTGTANSTPAYRLINASGGYVTGTAYNAASHGGGQGGLGASGLTSTYKGGGGGAGGYGANGGNGGQSTAGGTGSSGSGGGGGGGSSTGGAGGGGNLLGTTSTYTGGAYGSTGGRGGGGTTPSNTGVGSYYGGGGAAAGSVQSSTYTYQYIGAPSAVRIVFPGISRQFPSTDVSNTANTTNISA